MTNILNVEVIGEEDVYDLEVDHPDHQFFLANGVLTSNSHAVAYAIDSYWCSFLLTYYEPEWLCAYLESSSNNADKLAKAIEESKRLGWSISQIDINTSGDTWNIDDANKSFVPSFRSCKGIGEAAIVELMANRPYSSIEDLLWEPTDHTWRHSKANKRVFEGLIKVGAFESMNLVGEGKMFANYKQMHHVLIENMDELKKTPKKEPDRGRKALQSLTNDSRDMEDWSRSEKIEMSKELLGDIDINKIVTPKVMAKLEKMEIPSIDLFNGEGLYWFVAEEVTVKMTKNKKQYLLIKGMGINGKRIKLFVWSWDPAKHPIVSLYDVCLAEISQSDFGYAAQAWKLKVLTFKESEK